MDRTSREERAKRVERWRDSGLTAAEFAAELGINAHSLSWWKWRLAAEPAKRGFTRRSSSRSRASQRCRRRLPFLEMTPPVQRELLEIVLATGVRVRSASRLRRRSTGATARRIGARSVIPTSVRIFVCTERQDMRRSIRRFWRSWSRSGSCSIRREVALSSSSRANGAIARRFCGFDPATATASSTSACTARISGTTRDRRKRTTDRADRYA